MYVIVAENHDAYEKFLQENFKYVGDEKDIEKIDPSKVHKIVLAKGYDRHPIYFTDCFLKLQMEVAAYNAKPAPKKRWYQRWL